MATSVEQPLVGRAHYDLRVAGIIGRADASAELALNSWASVDKMRSRTILLCAIATI
jgi:hypothetical protein